MIFNALCTLYMIFKYLRVLNYLIVFNLTYY